MLHKLHEGHQSVDKFRLRAKSSDWWPGRSKQLEELVTNCIACSFTMGVVTYSLWTTTRDMWKSPTWSLSLLQMSLTIEVDIREA